MDEAEWLACTDPERLLNFLGQKVSERKLRLFACACSRRIWHFLPCERCQQAVECAERYADGLAGENERAESIRQVLDAYVPLGAIADAACPGTWTALDCLNDDTQRDRYEEAYQRAFESARASDVDPNEAREMSE